MVNLTLLEKIHRLSLNQNPMKKWSNRFRLNRKGKKSRSLEILRKKIRNVLNLISGGDKICMLKDILTKQELNELAPIELKDGLKNLTDHYKSEDFKKRHRIIRPLKKAKFKYHQLRKLGFPVSRHLWKSCSKEDERNLGGGNQISVYLQETIDSYLKENSNIASNRLVNIKNRNSKHFKEFIPARFLIENKKELFKKFPLADEISETTFRKYLNINNEYKNPTRITDLCDHCEHGNFLKTKIENFLKTENSELFESFDVVKLKKIYIDKALSLSDQLNLSNDQSINDEIQDSYLKLKSVVKNLDEYDSILFHKNVAACQRLAYRNHQTNIEYLREKILIDVDFKQKIVIGLSPRQISSEYYNVLSLSCLGFGVYYVGSNGKIKCINFDIISSDEKQDSYSAVRGFRILRDQPWFKEIEKDDYLVWSDCGKSFRNNELVGYLLLELAEQKKRVNLSFFGEKHGKNSRDSHFSVLSKFIKDSSLVKKLYSAQNVVDCILERQAMANSNKADDEKHVTFAFALDCESDTRHKNNYPVQKTLTIQNLESFYNYRTIDFDFKLVTSILTNREELMEIKIKQQSTVSHADYQVIEDAVYIEPTVLVSTLQSKQSRIISAFSKIQDNFQQIMNPPKQIDASFLSFFTLNDSLETNGNEIRLRPPFCREKKSAKKIRCLDCKAACSYSMESILKPDNPITQTDCLEELELHGHPKSRIIQNDDGSKRTRLTVDAARELADHYIYVHNIKEPRFLN